MASVSKFPHRAVRNQLRHNLRLIQREKNTDIDSTRTHENYVLGTCQTYKEAMAHYKIRLKEVYCYGRADVVTMASWVITCPDEIATPEAQRQFFEHAFQFLSNRYGRENVVLATVHCDEGKAEEVHDRWGHPILDESGAHKKEVVLGHAHLHFCFVPVVKDSKHQQGEKICAKEVLTKRELQHFHDDLQKWLDDDGIHACVKSGITKRNGGNITVAKLKENYDLKKENERLRKQIDKLQEHEVKKRW